MKDRNGRDVGVGDEISIWLGAGAAGLTWEPITGFETLKLTRSGETSMVDVALTKGDRAWTLLVHETRGKP